GAGTGRRGGGDSPLLLGGRRGARAGPARRSPRARAGDGPSSPGSEGTALFSAAWRSRSNASPPGTARPGPIGRIALPGAARTAARPPRGVTAPDRAGAAPGTGPPGGP